MQKSTALKSVLIVVAAALAGIAVADIDALNQYDELLLLVAGLMGGGAGIKRPGDVKVDVEKPPREPPPPPPSIGPAAVLLVAFVALVQQACGPSRDPKLQQSPCRDEDLAVVVAQCWAKVRTECRDIPDDECPAVAECDRKVDDWHRCGGDQ